MMEWYSLSTAQGIPLRAMQRIFFTASSGISPRSSINRYFGPLGRLNMDQIRGITCYLEQSQAVGKGARLEKIK
jgi:hypothetical protein